MDSIDVHEVQYASRSGGEALWGWIGGFDIVVFCICITAFHLAPSFVSSLQSQPHSLLVSLNLRLYFSFSVSHFAMSTETTKRARDAPPHAASAPSELGFDFAPPEMEEPIMSKKQRKLANYNPRGRPAAGTVYTPPVRAVEVVERMQEGRGEEGGAEEKVEGGEEGMQEATGEGEKMEEDPDVPALSHKALRLAKRRKLAGLPDVPIIPTSTAGNSIPGVPGVIIGNTPGKSAHGIWLGNMNYGTTNKMLLAWLEERGLKEIVRINMPSGRREGEMNRGFVIFFIRRREGTDDLDADSRISISRLRQMSN